jgi:hypothetical protein
MQSLPWDTLNRPHKAGSTAAIGYRRLNPTYPNIKSHSPLSWGKLGALWAPSGSQRRGCIKYARLSASGFFKQVFNKNLQKMDVLCPRRFVYWTFCNWMFVNWTFCILDILHPGRSVTGSLVNGHFVGVPKRRGRLLHQDRATWCRSCVHLKL